MTTAERLIVTFVLNSAWQICIVTLLAWGCDRALRRAPARTRHAVWKAALAACLLLPLVSVLGVLPRAPQAATATQSADFAAATEPAEGVPVKPWLPAFIVPAFIAAVVWHVIRLIRDWQRARLIRETAFERELPANAADAAVRCTAAMGLPPIPVLRSVELAGPATLGAVRPVVIIPERLLEEASPEVLTAMLGHELAHVRRRDYLWNLLCECALPLIGWHPAARLVRAQLAETRELACDEMVAGALLEPKRYARSLVRVAQLALAAPQPSQALGIFDAGILEHRIVRLLQGRDGRMDPRRAAAVLAASLVLIAAITIPLAMAALAPRAAASTALAGTVYDASGAVVPGARVLLTNAQTGAKRKAVTDDPGEFLCLLEPGDYMVEVARPGFQRWRGRITVQPAATTFIRPVLNIGRISERITVSAKVP